MGLRRFLACLFRALADPPSDLVAKKPTQPALRMDEDTEAWIAASVANSIAAGHDWITADRIRASLRECAGNRALCKWRMEGAALEMRVHNARMAADSDARRRDREARGEWDPWID